MAANFSTAFNPTGASSPDFLADWGNTFKYKPTAGYGAVAGETQPAQTSEYKLPPVSALPSDYADKIRAQVELERQLQPLYLQQAQAQAKFGAEATRQQMADLFPYLSAASSEATARNLAASTQFLLTKEQTPTAQSARNVAAQSQMSSAAGAEAERDRATAAQALAAKEFARGYAGQTFRMT
jgi:hypothetical protein